MPGRPVVVQDGGQDGGDVGSADVTAGDVLPQCDSTGRLVVGEASGPDHGPVEAAVPQVGVRVALRLDVRPPDLVGVGGQRVVDADGGDLHEPLDAGLPGCVGVKVFMGSSTGSLLVSDDAGVKSILSVIRRRAAFHSEDEYRLEERKPLRVPNDPSSHPVWRDPEAALMSTKRLVRLARETGKRIHVLHISTAEEMLFLADHKDVASVEVTPHHLTLDETAYTRLGTYAQMNPPVRDKAHRDGIWAGVSNGVVDVLGSDHAPHTREEKEHIYPDTHSGMTGVQTLVPIMLDHVNAGRLSLQRFVDLTSHGPQRLFGIRSKGRIAVGYDADFTVVDLKRRWTVGLDWLASRCDWSPFEGMDLTGKAVGTIIRGHRVMWEDALANEAVGEPVRFEATEFS